MFAMQSIPEMHEDQTPQHAQTLDENRSDCVSCNRPNKAEHMVQCGNCQIWWHLSCASVSDSVENRPWLCPQCQVDDLASNASASRASRASGRSAKSARLNLQLEKLEELQAIQKKFVEEKYKLLESQIELGDDSASVRSKRSRVSRQSSNAKVMRWVNKCAEQTEAAPGSSSFAGGPSSLPPVPINQEEPNSTTPSGNTASQGQQAAPDGEHQQSPLKHPALPNQRSTPQPTDSNRQVDGILRTDPKQDGASASQTVFNRITGTIPLAQSTPTRIPPPTSLPLSTLAPPPVSAPVYVPEIPRPAVVSPPASVPFPTPASLPVSAPLPVPVSLAAASSVPLPALAPPPPCVPPSLPATLPAPASVPIPLPAPVSGQPHVPVSLPAQPSVPFPALAPPPSVPVSLPAPVPLPSVPVSSPAPASVPPSVPVSLPAPTSVPSSLPHRMPTVPTMQPPAPTLAPAGWPPAATPAATVPTSYVLPPGKPDNQPLPPDVDASFQHLLKQFGSIALSPSQIPMLNANVANFAPSPSQLAARQVMPRDLPSFSGNPADWPVFISSFMNTTLACGYSSAENLCRLQRCLRGAAYEAVQSRLLLPESVPHILETLHMLYGRPDLLISALLDKVRSSPAPRVEKFQTIIDFGMSIQSLCDHLEAAGQTAHLSNPSLLVELVAKLPPHLQMEWGTYLQSFPEVNLKTFGSFMSSVVRSVSKVTVYSGSIGSSGRSNVSEKNRTKTRGNVNTHQSVQNPTTGTSSSSNVEEEKLCPACKSTSHRIPECRTFKALSVDERWKCIQSSGLCRNCLNSHGRRSCRKTGCCGTNGCQFRHHPLLHSSRSNTGTNPRPPVNTAENHTHRLVEQSLLFRILPVTLHGPKGTVETFAFLDDGSSLTLVEHSLIDQLGVDGDTTPLCLLWTGNVTRVEKESKQISLVISAAGGKQHSLEEARTVKELSLPKQSLAYEQLVERYAYLKGLPVKSYNDAVPKILIGVNNLNLMVPLKIREGLSRQPVAAKTRLGWCIYGGEGANETRTSVNCHSCVCTSDQALHDLVKDFFTTEDVGTQPAVQLLSEEDKRAQWILEETTVRVGTHYETGLLWKYDHIELPDSYNMAVRRLECLERRMDRSPELKQALQKQLADYQLKGYAHRATEEELATADPRRVWYLPLGAVMNPRKPGKIRMIWDAKAAVNGISLNSVLLKGPDQLTSLPGVLGRFRQFCVGVSADLKEMFHQLFMRKQDRHSQRFVFRNDRSSPPDIYLMDVVTFGSTCSPASAQYVKNKNAEEFKELYPRAVEGIVQNHYVDDSLESYESIAEAIEVSRQMRSIHEHGGFELRNWLSNSSEVLSGLGEPISKEDKQLSADKSNYYERVLGLLWLTEEDAFSFSTQMKQEICDLMHNGERPIKRQMLKCLMSLFDPLGLLCHFAVHGKILLQEVWRSGVQWDEKVNDDLHRRWINWTSLFEEVQNLKIPRCYFPGATSDRYRDLQLHIFVDASESAYCAAAYFRTLNSEGIPDCVLVAARTKVAPLKMQSVPRLELQAAVLGARLMQFVEESHTLVITRKVLWSDSATVLSWLRADHRRYKQFVACRIGELLTVTDVENWRWVPSKQNPADIGTKWEKGPDLAPDSVWFKGPAFLQRAETEWPKQRTSSSVTEEELRPCHAHKEVKIPDQLIDLERFSRLNRVHRAVGYVLRFVGNLKLRVTGRQRSVGPLTSEELQKAEQLLIRQTQWQSFSYEMMVLTLNRSKSVEEQIPLAKGSNIYQLCPTLDEEGIIRVDGRIGAAPNVAKEMKFPVILPRSHAFTNLVLNSYHHRHLHGNAETIVNEIRQRYHIPKLRTAVNKVMKACQWCRIYKASPKIPRMAPLPLARMASFVRPFTYVGIDFFGPLAVKVGRSNAKRWVALFTCLTIRAVHVEVAYNLSTDSCMKCIRRFICRRGSTAEIYSDNGTNFQGAERLLREQIEQLAVTFTGTNTKWIFNPPGTPHMGGAWERMVRSIKTAVDVAYSNNRKLDDEALETFMVEAEAIVNSRPLTYLPLTSEEYEALTPNHFLLGSSSGVRLPAVEATDSAEALRSSWGQIQQQLDVFWRRWIREYLPTLTKRPKWCGEVKPIAEGELVLVVGDGKRNEWTRGRIVQVIKGVDGRIRQAMIQTARGLVRRPVARLVVLEVDELGKTGPGGQCYGGEDVDTGNTVYDGTVEADTGCQQDCHGDGERADEDRP